MNRIPPGKKPRGGKGSKDDPAILTLGSERDEDAAILERARKRFDYATSSESENRTNGIEDQKFKAGDQWPASIAAQRNNDHRPCFTENRIPTFVNQVTNEQRIERPAINVSPVGDRSDPEVAKMLRGLIRYFERECHADLAYDTAFDSAASIGWGYWRMLTDYAGENTFDQTILIQRIRNTMTVYMDPMCMQPDASDAKWAFVTELIPRDEFTRQYPDADPMQWTESAVGDTFKNWVQDKTIRVAEYYEVVTDKRDLVMLSNGHTGWKDELHDGVLKAVSSGKLEIMREREVDVRSVKYYKITAVDILERQDWAGYWIPLVRTIGNEIDIEGKVTLSGIIRNCKESQRLLNYSLTSMIEAIALQPKAPYVMAEGQEEGHEDRWENANTKNYPYLLYKPTSFEGHLAPPPQRSPPALAAQGWEQMNTAFAQGMMATTGIRFDATVQERMIDESGRALRELKRASDTGSLHYYDNLCRSLRHTGDMYLDLIPKVIDTRRMVTILREDDSEEQVMIDPTAEKTFSKGQHPKTGKVMKIYNPSIGKYGVTVTIGPSYATKRIEAAESMMKFIRALPAAANATMDLIAKNQDWPDAEQFETRLKKMLPPGMLTPEGMQDWPPEAQAVVGNMQQQLAQLTQLMQAAQKELADKRGDQALAADKASKDFEAKLLKVVSDVETKMAAIQEKAQANYNTHIVAQMKEFGGAVKAFEDAAGGGKGGKGNGKADPAVIDLPVAALQHLHEERVTTFANGQKWTLHKGKPARVH